MSGFGKWISRGGASGQGRGGSRPPPLPGAPPEGRSWRDGAFAFDLITLLLLAPAVIYWLLPGFILIAMISIIGLPIAIVAMLAGLIAFPLLLGHAIYWGLVRGFPGRRRGRQWLAGVGLGVLLFALAGVAMNLPGRRAARELIAQDHTGEIQPIARGAVLGYLGSSGCDTTCQRLLLNGQARAVVIAARPREASADPLALPATRWWLERSGAPCPKVNLSQGGDIEPRSGGEDAPPTDLVMAARIASGECLLSARATLAEADTVWAGQQLQTAPLYSFASGTAALTVNRRQIWQRQGEALVEVSRLTSVRAEEIFPWPVPVWHWGGIEKPHGGYPRRGVNWNRASRYEALPPMRDLLLDTLRLDLDLPAGGSDAAVAAQIAALLDTPGPLAPEVSALIARFQQSFSVNTKITPEDWPFYLRLFSDPRLTPDADIGFALSHAATARPALWPVLAEAGFTRLAGTKKERRAAVAALREAPVEVLAPYRDRIFALACDPERRIEAGGLLQRLRDFGPEGQAALLWLIDDAGRFSGEAWQAPYLAGMIGLCKAGPAAQALAPGMQARLNAGQIRQNGAYLDLALSTLLQLGIPPEDFRAPFETGENAITPTHFDLLVKRFRAQPDCGY
ncbi:MAG: hypothetical protein AB7U46_01530 [Paenirhodobacter sp.]|uniref:hypothetical protein n=1 Tax=Paenirhodobacter sp. TaxID=1965326 RepID=UPI003D0CB77D